MPGDRDAQTRRSREWESRPGLSRAVRVVVFVGPVGASFGVAAVLSHLLPRADGPATFALWATVIALASLGTLVLSNAPRAASFRWPRCSTSR